ncbi:GNAT family N-acetyltransferase [Cohnella candidum]|uniref:GNAT family N-acetyltransferase n=1 Tax=Cohnella candidum TaxID=2674991 RepID=A0A3G3K5F6_9BACL|nr:GNAT family N-acetyltransferase [Cohnella candidum]AYQ75726.1 GNAT family N-acetyltransferase [Cohnella candidum]
MELRDALQGERSFIREQRVNAYREHAESVPDAHWQALARALASEADNQPGVELIVAVIDGNIAGSVALFPADSDAYEGNVDRVDYPEIRMLAVSPEYRGKGVASALLKECMARAKSSGCKAIGLHTGEFMTNAIKLYEKLGFKRLPQYDFQPAGDGITVKAFRLSLEG